MGVTDVPDLYQILCLKSRDALFPSPCVARNDVTILSVVCSVVSVQ